MKVEVNIKGYSTSLFVPPERSVKWLIEAAQLWAQEAKGIPPQVGKS
jgi:hypothetical protein